MTVICAQISREHTIHAADSLLTKGAEDGTVTPIKTNHPKIILIPRFNGAISYWAKSSISPKTMIRMMESGIPEHAEGYSVQEIIGELTADELRNKLIVADVLNAVSERRSPIVLTKRKEHLQILLEMLKGKVKNIIVFQGGLGLKKLAKLTEQLSSVPRDEERVVLAIGQCIGEGFDDPRLDTLFLAMPISFRGRLEQYVGRLHRAHEGKSIVKIYDYVDVKIEAMYRMYKKRRTGYKQIGYEIDMPG